MTPAAPEVFVMTTALIVFTGGTVFLQIFAKYGVTLSSPAQISPAVLDLDRLVLLCYLLSVGVITLNLSSVFVTATS